MSKARTLVVKHRSECHKAFIEDFEYLAAKHSRMTIWSDFTIMSACAIPNACDKRYFSEREKKYQRCAEKYSTEELARFPKMLSQTVLALESNPKQDFLGEIFGDLSLHNEWRGQFFTPYHIGELMARMNLDGLSEKKMTQDIITVTDPCCGAGCLIIACANAAKDMGIDYKRKLMFFAQDIDDIAALMCYIQLSLLGCKAIVKIGNYLTEPMVNAEELTESHWLTPMLICGELFERVETAMESETDGVLATEAV